MCFRGNNITFYPKHYLQKFHAKYADADELAQLTMSAASTSGSSSCAEVDLTCNPDLPTVRPWRSPAGLDDRHHAATPTTGRWTPRGTSPYIDEVMRIVNDAELTL